MIDTQVGIIGAGPAGLVLSHLLDQAGIDTIVLECRDQAYAESRIRAGVLEHTTVEILDRLGLADRLHREGLVHNGVYLQFEGQRHRIDLKSLTGKSITVYGQQEVVKDLINARLKARKPLYFEAEVTQIIGFGDQKLENAERPVAMFARKGEEQAMKCDFIIGCDGFYGASRAAIPAEELTVHSREYPFGWLGILADVAPSTDELIYAFHERGFAMHSLRSPTISRLYLQVDPNDDIMNWPDSRIWDELQIRLAAPEWILHEGPILEKSITPMRSFVASPMSFGNLFLAGDAAHIVPPTGAKGLNLAVADVSILAEGIESWYRSRDRTKLDFYSDKCLQRVWRCQDFSNMMTALMHPNPNDDLFDRMLQKARQSYVCSSYSMASSLAENYVGLPLDRTFS